MLFMDFYCVTRVKNLGRRRKLPQNNLVEVSKPYKTPIFAHFWFVHTFVSGVQLTLCFHLNSIVIKQVLCY